MMKGAAITALLALVALGSSAQAQPTFGNASPNAGSSTSEKANAQADQGMYKEIEYANKSKRGPALIVIPGEMKNSNASFMQKFTANNIADFAEIELSNANFPVLERANLGALMNEISVAYNLGEPAAARKTMQVGKLKTTKWIVKFDIMKAEHVASQNQGFNGQAIGGLLGRFTGGSTAGTVVSNVQTSENTGIWLIGLRYKIIDANTTEQVATGYKELKQELGAKQQSIMGVSSGGSGGVGLDTMVQRLVQTAVWDIDSKYK
jgi:hypothetical protein